MKKSISNQLRGFIDSLATLKGYSDETLRTYDGALREALRYVEINKESDTVTIDLMPYRVALTHLNSKTISKKLSAVRSFVEYLNTIDMKTTLVNDSKIKVAKTLPKPISHVKIDEALELSSSEIDRLIVVMLYTLGLRVSELANLKKVDISDKWIRVLGKGSKDRDIPLLASTKLQIDEYLDSYEIKTFLFEKNGKKLSENSLRYTVGKVFAKIGMRVTPHQLRHSFATELLNSSARISDVSELLGHSSMATTEIYTKLGSALIEKNYNKAHPLAGGLH